MPTLLVNAVRTPDGTILHSKHRHDYVSHTDIDTGKTYAVDGGTTCPRYIGEIEDCENLCLISDDPHEEIREMFCWKTYGEFGNEQGIWVYLKDMSDQHIKNIIKTQPLKDHMKKLFNDELKYRENLKEWMV